MTLNNQPIEKVVRESGGSFVVHSIFHTIQGEGPFCGTPAVFIRLAGCNLQCPWCDTDYTSSRMRARPKEIVDVVNAHPIQDGGLVVITGGEPFRQPIGPLLMALIDAGFYVQVETNGTLPPPNAAAYLYNTHELASKRGVYLVCSPKTGKVNPELVARACCFKYVLTADSVDEDDGLPLTALGHTANPKLARPPGWWDRPIYVQPADHQDYHINRDNTEAAVKSCMRFGYTIQLQIHKLLGME